jgi:N-acetylglucosamine kinase-like BadF-type ATPase
MGLAGIWLEEEKMRAMNLLRTLARTNYNIKLENLIVCSDVELAHQGAFSGDTGIVTIVGTGSIALGNPAKKKLIRCGGWGIELDDEGSGAWIGREGLTAVVRELDGRGKKTNLTQIVKSEISGFDIEQPRTIVKEYNEGKFAYQNLTPLVMQCAEEGDEVCLNIINRSAHHLLELPMALVKQFKAQKVNVVLMGGIIENDTLLSKLLIDLVNKEERLNLLEPKGTAITGAIALGMQLLKDIEEE